VREEIGIEMQIDGLLGTTHFYRGPAVPENELAGVIFVLDSCHRSSFSSKRTFEYAAGAAEALQSPPG
jgi:hypothetical protein